MNSRMQRVIRLLALSSVALALPTRAPAQQESARWLEECRSQNGRPAHCEVRETTLPAGGSLQVDATPNGGVSVHGWDRNEVLVQARLRAQAPGEAEAREIASRVEVRAGGGRVSASGPEDLGSQRSWSVSYQVWVPRRTDLELQSQNGGLSVAGVRGELQLSTTNGGISLERVGGAVRGRTTNGGIRVRLEGSRWEGEGLELSTTNGGVSLAMPESYSASLHLSTVNGGVSGNIPVVRRRWTGGEVNATLGQGGPPIRITTTNGGLKVDRS